MRNKMKSNTIKYVLVLITSLMLALSCSDVRPQCDEVFTPEPFAGVGTLNQKWIINNKEYKIGRHCFGEENLCETGYPLESGWGVLKGDFTYPFAVFDPSTGEMIHEYPIVGFQYKDSLIGANLALGGPSPYLKVDLESNEDIHQYGESTFNGFKGEGSYMYTVNDNLLIFNKPPAGAVFIRCCNIDNGEVLWQHDLKGKTVSSNIFYSTAVSDKYFFCILSIYNIAGSELLETTLHRIDIETSDVTSVDLELMHNPELVMRSDNLYIFFGDCSRFYFVDAKSLSMQEVVTNAEPVENVRIYRNLRHPYFLHNSQVAGDKVLLKIIPNYTPEDEEYLTNPGPTGVMLFDLETHKVTKLDTNIVWHTVNGELISHSNESIQSLNPQTLQPIWWIDLSDSDIGENPRVIWCDWRGVLVMSDTKLVCYDAVE